MSMKTKVTESLLTQSERISPRCFSPVGQLDLVEGAWREFPHED